MRFSTLTELECPRCHRRLDPDQVTGVCDCGSPLLVRYDLDDVRAGLTKHEVATREPSLWRYHELLPVRSVDQVVSLGEGMTPVLPLRRLGVRYGLSHLLMGSVAEQVIRTARCPVLVIRDCGQVHVHRPAAATADVAPAVCGVP